MKRSTVKGSKGAKAGKVFRGRKGPLQEAREACALMREILQENLETFKLLARY